MKHYLLIIFTPFVLFAGCQDDAETEIVWSPESIEMVKKGIETDYQKSVATLSYSCESQTEVSVTANADWLSPSIIPFDNGGELTIEISANTDMNPRKGEIQISSRNKTTVIRVSQTGMPKVTTEKGIYYLPADGGEVEIKVKAHGKLSAEPYPKECCSWAKVTGIEPCGTDEFAVTLRISKNEGLGRIVAVDFKIDGKPAIQECGPCVIQCPAPFGENVSIVIEKEGSLPVLLGDELENLRHIRSLTLAGAINEIDFPVLKKLFLDTEDSFAQYPIDIDLTECGIISGSKNPYEYYGWTPTETYEEILFWGELPSDIFNNALNLKGIVLPKGLKAIDSGAFSGCRNLKRISIPNTVEEINSKAFYGCTGLEEISIDSDCNLTTIGNQAFATGSVLKSLTIPMTVSNMSGEAFLGCKATELHLCWLEPYEINIVPKTEGCTLFVPKGTAELYRNARNWCNFKEIIEE